jgi:hypothetical protein
MVSELTPDVKERLKIKANTCGDTNKSVLRQGVRINENGTEL